MEPEMPYTETITRDGETTTGRISDAGALSTLRRGKRLGATATVTPDGSVTIVRTVLHLTGEDVTETHVTVTLTPDAKPHRLTKAQYENLKWIRAAGSRAELRPDGRIGDVFCQLPPAAAARLFKHGLAVAVGARVEVGIAGLLAMTAYEHPARTTRPRGWYFPTNESVINRPRVQRTHPYQKSDFTSTAVCPCGGLHSTKDSRQYAVAAVRAHLTEELSAALVAA
jgi:hypothetical protein